ncbi:MAG: hypothetical protein GY749_03380 [Desulfobacteraceae bacterium]|nr:hypothetical protein [Desulfobacteraceae bacterium]
MTNEGCQFAEYEVIPSHANAIINKEHISTWDKSFSVFGNPYGLCEAYTGKIYVQVLIPTTSLS